MESDKGVSGILKRRPVDERARELRADFTRLEALRSNPFHWPSTFLVFFPHLYAYTPNGLLNNWLEMARRRGKESNKV